jgi:hypothetical protein
VKSAFLLAVFCLVIACKSGDDELTPDQEIVQKAYSMDYYYPEDFEYEVAGDYIYYENTVSIHESDDSWIELHTDDIEQARAWCEESLHGQDNYVLDTEYGRETEKFFEFKKHNSGNANVILLSRIHKSSYFIPTYDKFTRPSTIGTLMVRPIDTHSVKEFIEYGWTNYLFGHEGKVLEYTVEDHSANVTYKLTKVQVVYGDFGICDEIQVTDYHFAIDKASGEITFEFERVKNIQGTCR